MAHVPNLFQMYLENGFKFGFYVRRDSWSPEKYAKVVGIEGVEEGKMIEGKPPYFTRKYPEGHRKAGNFPFKRIGIPFNDPSS